MKRRLTTLACTAILGGALVAVAGPATAQANHTGEFNVRSARLSFLGSVVVTGTLTCQAPGYYDVEVMLTQEDQGLVEGANVNSGLCSDTGNTEWQVTVLPNGLTTFYPGEATAQVIGLSCEETPELHCESDAETQTVIIKG